MKKPVTKKPVTPRSPAKRLPVIGKPTKRDPRAGRAIWVGDPEIAVLQGLSDAEDRPLTTIIIRALRLYASKSPEWQQVLGQREAAD